MSAAKSKAAEPLNAADLIVWSVGGSDGGFADGAGDQALFKAPRGIAVDPVRDVVLVADTGNHRVRESPCPLPTRAYPLLSRVHSLLFRSSLPATNTDTEVFVGWQVLCSKPNEPLNLSLSLHVAWVLLCVQTWCRRSQGQVLLDTKARCAEAVGY
jgi:hypothetical protein